MCVCEQTGSPTGSNAGAIHLQTLQHKRMSKHRIFEKGHMETPPSVRQHRMKVCFLMRNYFITSKFPCVHWFSPAEVEAAPLHSETSNIPSGHFNLKSIILSGFKHIQEHRKYVQSLE